MNISGWKKIIDSILSIRWTTATTTMAITTMVMKEEGKMRVEANESSRKIKLGSTQIELDEKEMLS